MSSSLHFSTISRNISQISPNIEVTMSNKTFLLARASNFCWPIHQLLYNLSGCIVNLSKINSLINRYKVSVDKKVTCFGQKSNFKTAIFSFLDKKVTIYRAILRVQVLLYGLPILQTNPSQYTYRLLASSDQRG